MHLYHPFVNIPAFLKLVFHLNHKFLKQVVFLFAPEENGI